VLPRRPHRARAALVPLLAGALACVAAVALSGCSPTISVPVAPHATDPRCADVLLDVPDNVADQPKVTTTSQATAAWGSSGAAITLRCGVDPPGPSDQCQAIANPDGTSVDWIGEQTSTGWTFVTYGRDPAIAVQVPTSLGQGQPTVALVDVAKAVADVPQTAVCT
jgi:hypothetical protein